MKKRYSLTISRTASADHGGKQSSVTVSGSATASAPQSDSTHEHSNLSDLEKISVDDDGYLWLRRLVVNGSGLDEILRKVKAGYADIAGELAPDSPTRNDFLSRIADDIAQGRITFAQGLKAIGISTIGEGGRLESEGFDSDIYAGQGWGLDGGTVTADKVRVRHALETMELLVNRIRTAEGDTIFAPSDTIERIESGTDGTYDIYLRPKWEGYFTSFQEGDVLRGVYNSLAAAASSGNLSAEGAYLNSWLKVNTVNPALNLVNVTMYPAEECPASVNHAPVEEMALVRWGNTHVSERQSSIVISATERRIKLLEGVTSPILGKDNQGVVIGKAPEFLYENGNPYNLNDLENILYVKRIFTNQINQIEINGQHAKTYVDFGQWEQGADYPCDRKVTDEDSPYFGKWITADVWHSGCKWRCAHDGATDEPRWNSVQWAMIEGNPEFKVEFTDYSDNDRFDFDNFHLTLTIRATLYGQDVTADLLTNDIVWTRRVVDAQGVEHPNSDTAWAIAKAQERPGASVTLTKTDIGTDTEPQLLSYTCTCTLRDGMQPRTSQITLDIS